LTPDEESNLISSLQVEATQSDAIKLPVDLGGKILMVYDFDKTKRDNALRTLTDSHLNFLRKSDPARADLDQVILIPESIVS
jgi:transcription antitermination factor NusA-like protein